MDNVDVINRVGKKILMLGLVLGMFLMPSHLLCASPELDYVKIYKKINSASKEQKQGNKDRARKLFSQSFSEINTFRKKYPTWLVQTDKEYFIRQQARQIERQMLGENRENNFTKMKISRDPV